MKRNRRAAGLVGGACLALAVLALAWPGGPSEPRVAGPPEDPREALLAAARRKLALKAAAIDDLIAGRLTLAAAVDRFEALEGEFPELAEGFRRYLEAHYPGRGFRERLAHSVLAYCDARVHQLPYSADVVLARLHAELAAFLRSEGDAAPPGKAAGVKRGPALSDRPPR